METWMVPVAVFFPFAKEHHPIYPDNNRKTSLDPTD